MTLFDMSGKSPSSPARRAVSAAPLPAMAEHGAKVVISSRSRCLRPGGKRDQRQVRQGKGGRDPANISSKENLQHLVDESNRAFGRIDVWSATRRPSVLRAARRHFRRQFRKILDNNIVANNC